jgi:hypothetical protein
LRQFASRPIRSERGFRSVVRNEEQDSGLRRSAVERNKERDGFVRLRWADTKEQDAVDDDRLTIEIGAEFPIGITTPILRAVS